MKTFVIAEAGANHDRNFNQALKLIDAASDAGASAVKFQTYSSETLYSKHTPDFAGYKNIPKLIKDIELPREWQKDLKQYCDEQNIEFMSTPFDEQAVDELVGLGVKRLKIAGFESTDWRFVDMVASTGLPLIISIGIGFELNKMGYILDIVENYGNEPTAGVATFNVSPSSFGKYYSKLGCFCFEKQELKAGEKATFVMTFYLDPEMVNDPNTKNLEDVTMSYTFFSTDYYKQS